MIKFVIVVERGRFKNNNNKSNSAEIPIDFFVRCVLSLMKNGNFFYPSQSRCPFLFVVIVVAVILLLSFAVQSIVIVCSHFSMCLFLCYFCAFSQMHPMNQMTNANMGMNTMNALAQVNQMSEMQQTNNPMAKMQGMANG